MGWGSYWWGRRERRGRSCFYFDRINRINRIWVGGRGRRGRRGRFNFFTKGSRPDNGSQGGYVVFYDSENRPLGGTERFSQTEVRLIFLHELGHIKRGDLAVNWLAAG